ncbi:MAG: wax ester/triacylglycerol synthase family O-acyltransferase, partial [Actinobacteria bacterium]|nr:wax ester/triacylglycerol synthase family O-acyltransferase [Actinomycetota bacterium]
IGFVAKIHHCAADGVAAAAMLASVLDTSPEAPPVTPAPWHPDPVPSQRQLLTGALLAWIKAILNLPALLRRTFEGLRRVARRRKEADVSPPLPFSTPKTSFNNALTPHRTFCMTSMPLADFKAVKDTFGVTINDVLLAVCAGGLRRYLERRGELPDRPLVAGVPVSVRDGEAHAEGEYIANSVSNMFTSVPVQLEDPAARVPAIAEVTKAAKEVHKALGPRTLMDWSEITPPGPFAAFMRTYSRYNLANRHRPPINLVVSNVPGPREPLYIAGARVVGIWSMGPILESIGLNITVWSYLDQMNFGVVACRELTPDLWDLMDDLHEGLQELRKLA